MSIKKITQKLSKIRDNRRDADYLSDEDKQDLLELVHDTLMEADPNLKDEIIKNIFPHQPMPHNDNTPLTPDQKSRLHFIEKIGTGSACVH